MLDFLAYAKEEILADITRLRARIINVFKLGVFAAVRNNTLLARWAMMVANENNVSLWAVTRDTRYRSNVLTADLNE